jgi:hypothetical protein
MTPSVVTKSVALSAEGVLGQLSLITVSKRLPEVVFRKTTDEPVAQLVPCVFDEPLGWLCLSPVRID